jgi:hypothetical protein
LHRLLDQPRIAYYQAYNIRLVEDPDLFGGGGEESDRMTYLKTVYQHWCSEQLIEMTATYLGEPDAHLPIALF